MRSRIFSLFLSVLILFSSIQLIGFSKNEAESASSDVTDTAETGTVICNFKDIAYGSSSSQTFDLNLPVDNRKEIGILVFLHGGGWTGGDKAAVKKSVCNFASNKDYATASINYRLAGEEKADIYDILEDITAALTYIKKMAGGYGMNITKLILCGHSAGGHLALLYSYKYSKISPITPVGTFATASVPDLSSEAFYKNNSLGDEKYMCSLMSTACGVTFTPETRARYKSLLDELSPVNFVTRDTVPTVLVHGMKDTIAPYSGAVLLDDVLTENRVRHEVISIENAGHGVLKNAEKKKYAEDLMTACINEWFDITVKDKTI